MKKIALLGATGYIGKSLAYQLSLENDFNTFLFVRSKDSINKFLTSIQAEKKFNVHTIHEFGIYKYDVVINCIGVGNKSFFEKNFSELFKVTEKFDDIIMEYLEKNPETLYINLSSGAVYGNSFKQPAHIGTKAIIDVNATVLDDYYVIAKMNSELKHRSTPHLNIVDLRIFSFFSRFVDLQSGFLISQMIDCIKNKKSFITNRENIIRDYQNTEDLFSFMKILIKKGKINDVFDMYSAKPISKLDLLNFFKNKYGLQYSFSKNIKSNNPVRSRKAYYSENKKASALGYIPKFTSLLGIEKEIKGIF